MASNAGHWRIIHHDSPDGAGVEVHYRRLPCLDTWFFSFPAFSLRVANKDETTGSALVSGSEDEDTGNSNPKNGRH